MNSEHIKKYPCRSAAMCCVQLLTPVVKKGKEMIRMYQ